MAFLEEEGRLLREEVRRILAAPPGEWDPIGLAREILASQGAPSGGEGTTPTQAKRRRALLFLQLLQQEGSRSFRASLLEGPGGHPYDPGLAKKVEAWLDRCFQAEQRIIWNLDPTLVLEVLLMGLARTGVPGP